jgi:type II restriction enzyme
LNRRIKIKEAQIILAALGMPRAQQNRISALTLLALCGLRPHDAWTEAKREARTITKGIMDFVRRTYQVSYAPNTRETFRRQVLHQLVLANVADYNPFTPELPTNSPKAHYAISEGALKAIQKFGGPDWSPAIKKFAQASLPLTEVFERRRKAAGVPIHLPGSKVLELSPGKHNETQRSVVEQFLPRFAPDAKLLYLGDTAKKALLVRAPELRDLRFPADEHDKLPDIVVYDETRNWLFLIEVVTSHGPMSPKRVLELERMLAAAPAGIVYVSAFPTMAEFRKHLRNIA